MDQQTANKLDRLLAEDGLSGPEADAIFDRVYATVAREERVTLVPFLLEGVAAVPRLNQSDGIHPNREGARIVAENVWRTLSPALARLGAP